MSSSFATAQPAPPRRGAERARILRACVVQNGKVIEEQRLSKREPLTIGYG
ncbi:MAG: hypothetical protein HYZ27_09665, partial [Deltaproteobacteria bacterium]|nr:hypothetical protein [Deltaproteobacteria bacterium]